MLRLFSTWYPPRGGGCAAPTRRSRGVLRRGVGRAHGPDVPRIACARKESPPGSPGGRPPFHPDPRARGFNLVDESLTIRSMAFLIVGNERYALQIGETALGGANDEIPLALETVHATLFLTPEGTATIRREGDAPVSVNNVRLGAESVVLRHGDRVQVGGIPMVFGDIAAAGSTSLDHAAPESAIAALAGAVGGGPTADTGGRLVRVCDGATTAIPPDGLVIGRDPGSDLVLRDRGASRRHASVRPSLKGYLIADHSVNGLTVNGRRVDGAQVLGMGDIVRIGDDEFRFEADA